MKENINKKKYIKNTPLVMYNLENFWEKFPETKKLYDYDLCSNEFISIRNEFLSEEEKNNYCKINKPGYAIKNFEKLIKLSPDKKKEEDIDPYYIITRGIERIYFAPDIVINSFHRGGPSTLNLFMLNRFSESFFYIYMELYIRENTKVMLNRNLVNLEKYEIETNSMIAYHLVINANKYFTSDIANYVQRHFLKKPLLKTRIKSISKSILKSFKFQ